MNVSLLVKFKANALFSKIYKSSIQSNKLQIINSIKYITDVVTHEDENISTYLTDWTGKIKGPNVVCVVVWYNYIIDLLLIKITLVSKFL